MSSLMTCWENGLCCVGPVFQASEDVMFLSNPRSVIIFLHGEEKSTQVDILMDRSVVTNYCIPIMAPRTCLFSDLRAGMVWMVLSLGMPRVFHLGCGLILSFATIGFV